MPTKPCRLTCALTPISVVLAAVLLGGCSSDPAKKPSGDPLTDLRNPSLAIAQRAKAIEDGWADMLAGKGNQVETREAYRSMMRATNAPLEIRLRAADKLVQDTDPAELAVTREGVRLLVAREPTEGMRVYLSEVAARNQWAELVPALVTSWARPSARVDDLARPEWLAIKRLRPGVPPTTIAFEVMLNPPAEAGVAAADWEARTRTAAWELLNRLDETGTARATLLASEITHPVSPGSRQLLDLLRQCYNELNCIPRTKEEVRWLESLLDTRNADNAQWWGDSARLVSGLTPEQRVGLRLCHIEALRAMAMRRPDMVAMGRAELMSELESRIAPRRTVQRTQRAGPGVSAFREGLTHWADKLAWGDLLAALAVDDALAQPEILERLFAQRDEDNQDNTTEYGGVLYLGEGEFAATMFAPRSAERPGDDQFVASADMISLSDRGLAHYHFHAQELSNGSFAGPSLADIQYAARYARVCVSLTSIARERMDADVYLPSGAVIDLGVFERAQGGG